MTESAPTSPSPTTPQPGTHLGAVTLAPNSPRGLRPRLAFGKGVGITEEGRPPSPTLDSEIMNSTHCTLTENAFFLPELPTLTAQLGLTPTMDEVNGSVQGEWVID